MSSETSETQPQQTPSALVQLATAVENAPGAILGLIISTIISILTDPLVTSLTIGAVAGGFYEHSIYFGVTLFWVVYVVARMIGSHANSIAGSSQNLAQSVAYHAQLTSHLESSNPDTLEEPSHNE
jgi:bacteriorhodopsin